MYSVQIDENVVLVLHLSTVIGHLSASPCPSGGMCSITLNEVRTVVYGIPLKCRVSN